MEKHMEESQYASADDLVVDELSGNTTDVTLPNGKKVKIRGLSRYEHLLIGKGTDDANVIEQRMIRYGMIRPEMTEQQVEKWQKSGMAQTLGVVTDAIRELSGFGKGAQKSNVAEVRD